MKAKYFALSLPLIMIGGCVGGTNLDTRTFELQHLDREAVNALVEPYIYSDRPEAAGLWSFSGSLLTVRETTDNLNKIARVLEQYDLPRPSVRLHFQVIEANGAGESDPEIAEVELQLRELFRFDGYRLVAQAVIGATENSEVSQGFGSEEDPYRIIVQIVSVRGTADSGAVRLNVEFSAFRGSGSLATTVNARTGQTVVLGNAQMRRGGGTLILALKAELLPM